MPAGREGRQGEIGGKWKSRRTLHETHRKDALESGQRVGDESPDRRREMACRPMNLLSGRAMDDCFVGKHDFGPVPESFTAELRIRARAEVRADRTTRSLRAGRTP